MTRKSQPTQPSRRKFLKDIAVAGGAAAVAASTVTARAAEGGPPPAVDESTDRGYRLTPHVRRYYEKARF